jgi:hypothetical protein
MPSEMKTRTALNYRPGKRVKECEHVATQNIDNISSTLPKYHNSCLTL